MRTPKGTANQLKAWSRPANVARRPCQRDRNGADARDGAAGCGGTAAATGGAVSAPWRRKGKRRAMGVTRDAGGGRNDGPQPANGMPPLRIRQHTIRFVL